VETIDCLPWDAAIGQRWAGLVVDVRRKGKAVPQAPITALRLTPIFALFPKRFMAEAIRILIAGDHPMLREGLRMLLETQSDFSVIGEATRGEDALRLAQELTPDILLLDMAMPHLPGLEVFGRLGDGNSGVRTLLLVAAIDQPQALKALELGARGVVLKESPTDLLFKSIRSVMTGQHWVGRDTVSALVDTLVRQQKGPAAAKKGFGLTRRELDVLALVIAAYVNREIATRLRISESTVKHHLTSIFDKTGASSRLELALFTLHHHLLQPD